MSQRQKTYDILKQQSTLLNSVCCSLLQLARLELKEGSTIKDVYNILTRVILAPEEEVLARDLRVD